MEDDRTRAKITAELESLFKDEKAHIAKYSRTAKLLKWGGIASLMVGLAITGMPWDWQTAGAVLFATLGAFLAGVSVAFDNSLSSWPIIRTLLKDDALEILKAGPQTGGAG